MGGGSGLKRESILKWYVRRINPWMGCAFSEKCLKHTHNSGLVNRMLMYLWLGTLVIINGPSEAGPCELKRWPISCKLLWWSEEEPSQDLQSEEQDGAKVWFPYSGVSVHRLVLRETSCWRRLSRQQLKMANMLQSLPVVGRCLRWLFSWWYWNGRCRTLPVVLWLLLVSLVSPVNRLPLLMLLLLDCVVVPSLRLQQLLLSPLSHDDRVEVVWCWLPNLW